MRESLVLRDIKREMLTTAFGTFDLAYTNPSDRAFQQKFVQNAVPWLATPDDGRSSQEQQAEELVNLWYEYQEMKAEHDATEKTRLSE